MASNNNSNPFPLRIKLKSGQPILLENLTTDTTIGDLKAILSGITGYNWSQLRILSGFPPKPVNLNLDDMETISTLSLRPKDLIIIDVASNEIIGENYFFQTFFYHVCHMLNIYQLMSLCIRQSKIRKWC